MYAPLKRSIRHRLAQIVRIKEVRDAIDEYRFPSKPRAIAAIRNRPGPYCSKASQTEVRLRDDIIFVTGRFRSGSTALWNAFRQLNQVTSYYEPFNERQFFNKHKRGSEVDHTHVGVTDYSAEYNSIEGLEQLYDEDWTRHDLYMDENSWNPDMARFMEIMIENSLARPVMQFNRIDFRLPWIRSTFPNATIVHIWRDPRDQWCSTLQDLKKFPSSLPSNSVPGNFYLHAWVRDLKRFMPFLCVDTETHPYRLFYYLWKTSYLFGINYAHTSLSFNSLMDNPAAVLQELATATGLDDPQNSVEAMRSILTVQKHGKWRDYATPEWFDEHESACETVLSRFFDNPGI